MRQILRARKLEDRVKIIVGGAPFRFHPEMFKMVGADTWAPDVITAGKAVEDLIREARQ